jgi:hypothetical protein
LGESEGRPGFGYGVSRRVAVFWLLGILLQVAAVFVLPALGYGGVVLPVVVLVLLAAFFSFLFADRAAGWFEVDRRGEPVRFVSGSPPAAIRGRRGVSRKRFLQEAAGR